MSCIFRGMRINSEKPLRYVCPSVSDVRNSSARAPPGRIFVIFDIRDLYENLPRNSADLVKI
jgi:hypothetical protein